MIFKLRYEGESDFSECQTRLPLTGDDIIIGLKVSHGTDKFALKPEPVRGVEPDEKTITPVDLCKVVPVI